MLYEFFYNHIIRGVGSSSLGILDVFENENKSNQNLTDIEKKLKQQNELQAKTIKRLFELTNQFVTTKMRMITKSGKNKKFIERLQAIQSDCRNMIKEFEKRGI